MSGTEQIRGAHSVASSRTSDDETQDAVILSLRDIVKRFGELVALNGLSCDVMQGEILGIAGPNGAGKTTLLNVCTGSLAPDAGTVVFEGNRMEGQPPYHFCDKGIARTFQIPRIFASMSIYDNVAVGATFGLANKLPSGRSVAEHVETILELTGLATKRNAQAGKVDLLTRKMTMLAAGLATHPKLVFMDEPLAGFTREEIAAFSDLITGLHDELKITFVVVEHKIRALARLSDRVMIVHQGARICLDTPEKVVRDRRVIEVYLGSEYGA